MRSVVRRYYRYRAMLSDGFYLPVFVTYMEARELGLAEIGLVQGLFLFATVSAELPTGYLGGRTALAIGTALTGTVMAGFVFADTVVAGDLWLQTSPIRGWKTGSKVGPSIGGEPASQE